MTPIAAAQAARIAWAAGVVFHTGDHPLPEGGFWAQWDPRLDAALVLLAAGAIYSLGWWRLRRAGHGGLATGWRLAAYGSGLAVAAFSLMGPVDVLQELLFAIHMVQHLLLMLVAAPLLVLAAPFPISLWGLPAGARRALGRWMAPATRTRRVLDRATGPWLVLAVHMATIWLWHTPAGYNGALRHPWVHDVQHITFFGTALAFWWCTAAAEPTLQPRLGYGLRLALVLMALFQTQILSIVIAMADRPLYDFYTTVPRLWGMSVMDDQRWSGVIMWVPGGLWYVMTAVLLLERMMSRQERTVRRLAARRAPAPALLGDPPAA